MLAAALCMLGSCSSDEPSGGGSNEFLPIKLDTNQKTIVDRNSRMAVEILDDMAAVTDKNEFISPLSLNMVLSMLANGAEGETREQILKLLSMEDGASLAELNELNKTIVSRLPGMDKRVKMYMANAIWLNSGFDPLKPFKSAVNDYYNAEIRSLNFETGMDVMNRWCADNTSGMIQNFFTTPPLGKAVIMNASYFDGEWLLPFDPSRTVAETFYSKSGATNKVGMMSVDKMSMPYHENDIMQMGILFFGNMAYQMMIILPREGKTFADCLDYDAYYDANAKCFGAGGIIDLKLPKFSLDCTTKFGTLIESKGMDKILGKGADYSGISNSDVTFDDIIQKSRIEVTETGAKAATVTATSGYSAPPPPIRSEMVVNRPFLFLIKESSTGTVVFGGIVNNL